MYPNFVSKIRLFLLQLFFPQTCLFCKTGREICCSKCFASIPQNVNFHNNILSLYYYSNQQINKLIWQMKYHHSGDIAKLFGCLMAEKLEKILFPIFPPTTQNIYLIPIPLNQNDKRLHNHAELLAREIQASPQFNIPPSRCARGPLERGPSPQEHFSPNIFVLDNLLIKNSKQKQSHTKSRQERLENVKNSFSINSNFSKGPAFAKPTSIFIIVDDVTTSNATINEARKTLSHNLQIPDTTIFAVTIAH